MYWNLQISCSDIVHFSILILFHFDEPVWIVASEILSLVCYAPTTRPQSKSPKSLLPIHCDARFEFRQVIFDESTCRNASKSLSEMQFILSNWTGVCLKFLIFRSWSFRLCSFRMLTIIAALTKVTQVQQADFSWLIRGAAPFRLKNFPNKNICLSFKQKDQIWYAVFS